MTVVVAASPDEENFKDFVKQMETTPRSRLPTLDATEARAFIKKCDGAVTDAEMDARFDKVGGVPRHLRTAAQVAQAVAEQPTALRQVHFEPGGPPDTANLTDTNKVVQHIPSADRTAVETYDFISANVRRLWIASLDATGVSTQLRRLREANDATRDVLGRFFEEWAIGQLISGAPMSWACCDQANQQLVEWVKPKPTTVSYFTGDDASAICQVTSPTLYVPRSSTFPVVDALLVDGVNVTLIQITVGASHKPKQAPTRNLFADLAKKKLKVTAFVWLVDASSGWSGKQDIEDGKVKAYDDVAHFLCRLDEHMCWVRKKGNNSASCCFPVTSPDLTGAAVLKEVRRLVEKRQRRSRTPPPPGLA